jgi:hypothetical protein
VRNGLWVVRDVTGMDLCPAVTQEHFTAPGQAQHGLLGHAVGIDVGLLAWAQGQDVNRFGLEPVPWPGDQPGPHPVSGNLWPVLKITDSPAGPDFPERPVTGLELFICHRPRLPNMAPVAAVCRADPDHILPGYRHNQPICRNSARGEATAGIAPAGE